jgi:hypothetical protein
MEYFDSLREENRAIFGCRRDGALRFSDGAQHAEPEKEAKSLTIPAFAF